MSPLNMRNVGVFQCPTSTGASTNYSPQPLERFPLAQEDDDSDEGVTAEDLEEWRQREELERKEREAREAEEAKKRRQAERAEKERLERQAQERKAREGSQAALGRVEDSWKIWPKPPF